MMLMMLPLRWQGVNEQAPTADHDDDDDDGDAAVSSPAYI